MSHLTTLLNTSFRQEPAQFHFPLKDLDGNFGADISKLHLATLSFECRNTPGRYWLVFDLIPVRPAPDAYELL